MVHALELVHSLLGPAGILVDIHPTGQPPIVEMTSNEKDYRLGELQETDDFIEYHQADEALSQALQAKLLGRIRSETFVFLTHADSLIELHQYLLENWSDVIWPLEINQRASHIYSFSHQKESQARLCEHAKITSFLHLGS